jgi:hypothetical protein
VVLDQEATTQGGIIVPVGAVGGIAAVKGATVLAIARVETRPVRGGVRAIARGTTQAIRLDLRIIARMVTMVLGQEVAIRQGKAAARAVARGTMQPVRLGRRAVIEIVRVELPMIEVTTVDWSIAASQRLSAAIAQATILDLSEIRA